MILFRLPLLNQEPFCHHSADWNGLGWSERGGPNLVFAAAVTSSSSSEDRSTKKEDPQLVFLQESEREKRLGLVARRNKIKG